MSDIVIGDRVKVVTKPNSYEYSFEVGETFIVDHILNDCVTPDGHSGRGYIKIRNIEIVRKINVIGGQLMVSRNNRKIGE